MPTTTADVLNLAVTYIERGWLQCRETMQAFAYDAADHPIHPSDSTARRWDLDGSIRAALYSLCGRFDNDVYDAAIGRVIDVVGTRRLGSWNDEPHRTVAEVIGALQRAAEPTRPIA